MEFSIEEKRILIRVLERNIPSRDFEISLLNRLISDLQFSLDSDVAGFMFPKEVIQMPKPRLMLRAA